VVAEGLSMVLEAQPDLQVVGVASTVAEVCELAASLRPDVVLMDYALPDGDGVAATAAIKAVRPELKVVMLTSFVDVDVLVAAIDAGCSGFVTKHKAGDELTTAVRLAAAGEALVSPEVLDLLAQGESKEAIAQRLFLSANTVRNHIQNILNKLGAHSRLEAVATATREGLIRHP
jgi:DNA-binding NarL/FixJ family response regulator